MGTVTPLLAFDRSERWKDADGNLHVGVTNISKATVNPYRGREIPGGAEMGLEPDRIYQLLRDPAELEAAAPTFNNLRLLSKHVAVSAANPQEDLVAGSTGTDAAFVAPYLRNSLVVWRAEDIEAVESGDKCQLSCAYYYDADMTPGDYEGKHYDGVMRNIRGNHVALVEAGRAGPDVMVHDSAQPMEFNMPLTSRAALMVKGALAAYLQPKLLPGTVLALDSALGSVNRLNWQKERPQVLAAVTALARPKLAKDASIDDMATWLMAFDAAEEEDDEVEAMDAEEEAEEAEARKEEEKRKASAEDRRHGARDRRAARDAKRAARDKAAKDAKEAADCAAEDAKLKAARDWRKGGKDRKALDKILGHKASDEEFSEWAKEEENESEHKGDSKAKDAKAMDAAIGTAIREERARNIAATEAREIVRPLVGSVSLALDSAEAIYRVALNAAKVDTSGVDPSAFKAMVQMIPKPGAGVRTLALDSAAAGGLESKFPAIGRINQA